MKIVGIIPGRGGSERIKDKNLRKFCGKPLLAWAILNAKKSMVLNRIIVSTDSPNIAKIAKKYGAEVPFLRPTELSNSRMGIEPVLKHAYEWLRTEDNYKADGLALIMATNPLRQPFHISEAVKIFKSKRADSVVSVNETPANHTPYWTLIKTKKGIRLFNGENLKNIIVRSQDFPQKCYSRNDLIYVLNPKNLFDKKPNLYGKKVELYETSTLFEADINTPDEWEDAEIKFRKLIKKKA